MKSKCFVVGFVLMFFVGGCGESDSGGSSLSYEDAVGEWTGIRDGKRRHISVSADGTVTWRGVAPAIETVESYEGGIIKLIVKSTDRLSFEIHQPAKDRMVVKAYSTRSEEKELVYSHDIFRVGERRVEQESSPDTSNTTIAIVVILLVALLGGGVFFISRGSWGFWPIPPKWYIPKAKAPTLAF